MVQNIDFSARGVSVDGQPVGFPVTTRSLQEVLPARVRTTTTETHEALTFDDLGLKFFTKAKKSYAEWIYLYTNVVLLENQGANPLRPFTGDITVEGKSIDRVPFREGWKEGLFPFAVGPYILFKKFGTTQGDYYEFVVAVPGADYFTRQG